MSDHLDKLAEERAWARGTLQWLMLPMQLRAYRAFLASSHMVFVVLCCRRWGKTRFACLLVWMYALATPNAIIRYAAPTKLHGRTFVQPAMQWITSMAPKYLRPRWVSQDNTWIWPNGAKCHLGSCESDADVDAQVGTECHFAVVDEAGKIKSELLRKLIEQALMHQLLTTDGKCMVLGTPSDTPDHYFRTSLVLTAQARGILVKHTIDACTHVSPSVLAKVLEELGGRGTTNARRELECEFVTETSRALIPEWPAHRHAIVREVDRPRHFDAYTFADTGFKDLSIAAFAYYWFGEGVIVVEDELPLRFVSGGAFGRAVLEKERELWGTKTPFRRWADASLQTLADMRDGSSKKDEQGKMLEDGIVFAMAEKQDADAAHERLRNATEHHRIVIHPRCKTIIAHMEHGIWNTSKSDYERVQGPDGHHFDGVAVMKYVVRGVVRGKNPAPVIEPYDPAAYAVSPHIAEAVRQERQHARQNTGSLADAFRRKT